ncbi:LysE family translocator [Vibrio makurazakiensis]|uniref:LysE family translocator n=1 Tax=Vibrio makurazakiensis TaxID=2910250 RepID=UPI003D112A16
MEPLILAMSIFAMVGAISPGPVNLVATSTAANYGFMRASLFVLGASVAYSIVVFISGNLLNVLASWIPNIELAMQAAGSLFLLYLAKKIALSPYQKMGGVEQEKAPSLIHGAIMQCINPKAWLVAMSGISLYVVGQSELKSQLVLFTSISLVACFIGVSAWALLGHMIRGFLQSESKQKAFNRVTAALLVLSVASIWV